MSSKIHYTPKYIFHKNGDIQSTSVCGLKSRYKHFINCTIDESRVNCKKCVHILNKQEKKK